MDASGDGALWIENSPPLRDYKTGDYKEMSSIVADQ
jgi:hypothetical protein